MFGSLDDASMEIVINAMDSMKVPPNGSVIV
jgi:hypothetical protein